MLLLRVLPFLKLPPIGFADAIILVLAEREQRTPDFAIEIVCYSIASRSAW